MVSVHKATKCHEWHDHGSEPLILCSITWSFSGLLTKHLGAISTYPCHPPRIYSTTDAMTQLHEPAPSDQPAFSSRPASPEPSTSSAQDPFPSLFPTRNAISYASKSSKRTVLAKPRNKTPPTLRNHFKKANTAVMTETVDLESMYTHYRKTLDLTVIDRPLISRPRRKYPKSDASSRRT